jgi:hypothetical protein
MRSFIDQTGGPDEDFKVNAPVPPNGETDEPPEGWEAYCPWGDDGGNNLD